jgi:DUF1680 family protein
MNRRSFLSRTGLALGALPLASSGFAAEAWSEADTAASTDTAASAGNTPMRDRYRLTLDRVVSGKSPEYTQEFLLEDLRPTPGRRFTEFSGDLSGRYIGALATAASAYGESFPQLDDFVTRAVALQKPQGYFGKVFHLDHPTDDDLALLWGNGRLLVGLLEYHRYKPSPQVLASAVQLGDFLISIAPLMNSKTIREEFGAAHFASGYICWTQQTEGLAMLYTATKEAKYRRLAAEISAVAERLPSDHVHGYLSSLRGTLGLYAATSDDALLRRCEQAWTAIASSGDILLTGGVPEAWSPKKLRTEGCAEADWVRLSLGLWQATGNGKYLDAAEKAIFNEFAMNQFASGDFGHRVLTPTGVTSGGAARAWWCCTLHGLRCFPDIQAHAVRVQPDGVHLLLPVDTHIEREGFRAEVTSTLAQNGAVELRVAKISSERILIIRHPGWANDISVSVDGKPASVQKQDGRVVLDGPLRAGQTIAIRYAMQLREERSGSSEALKDRFSYFHGPWLLGASSGRNPAYFNELHNQNRLLAAAQIPNPAKTQPASRFAVPTAATTRRFIPAEFPEQPGVVELRAVAEQTGSEPESWEMAFLRAEEKLPS